MGMFDYVHIEYPLPGNPPDGAKDLFFQTKDLAEWPQLAAYTITEEGVLWSVDRESLVMFTGSISAYWDNVVASGPGIYTKNGEDAAYLEYRATFRNGRLLSIEEVRNESHRAAKSKPHHIPELTPEELAQIDARRAERLTGRTMCRWFGGIAAEPESVAVVFETDRQLVLLDHRGSLSIADRYDRDSTLFDSQEDGQRSRDEQQADWDRRKVEYEETVRSRA